MLHFIAALLVFILPVGAGDDKNGKKRTGDGSAAGGSSSSKKAREDPANSIVMVGVDSDAEKVAKLEAKVRCLL
jgi:hypothetical protein